MYYWDQKSIPNMKSLQAFWRQTWRQKTMPDMASIILKQDKLMPCQASFFDAMFGVKKHVHFHYENGLLVSIVQ